MMILNLHSVTKLSGWLCYWLIGKLKHIVRLVRPDFQLRSFQTLVICPALLLKQIFLGILVKNITAQTTILKRAIKK